MRLMKVIKSRPNFVDKFAENEPSEEEKIMIQTMLLNTQESVSFCTCGQKDFCGGNAKNA